MLTDKQKKDLENRGNVDPKAKADLNYRISKKLEKTLQELKEINYMIGQLPRGTSQRVVNFDDLLEAAVLTESLLDLLDVAPIQSRPMTTGDFVARYLPVKPEGDGEIAYLVQARPATEQDKRVAYFMRLHISRMERFLNPNIRLPDMDTSDKYLHELRTREYFKDEIACAKKLGFVPACNFEQW